MAETTPAEEAEAQPEPAEEQPATEEQEAPAETPAETPAEEEDGDDLGIQGADAGTLVEVSESFTGRLGRGRNATTETFRQGEIVEKGHPAVRKWPQYFGKVTLAHPVTPPEVRS